ncbi:sensor histidine kinase [Paenibacillus sacheonensis]|uniref:histidine kinase n=1 Tax=Paenibacillus sacheonensis TaxID=742054 RepID=A0A7X4YPQ1_9BACL|nr:sensor histidine kinase [Paenibacillus sacheonensis]MBM7564940.1 sensor histidine kinase YesM [Paenibacillus sacheonensis]NBC70271.1 HAMP domain-containing protein [Paenibacillus sacheonensis]
MNSPVSLRLAPSLRNRMILIFFMIIIVPFLLFAYYAHIKAIEGISNANMTASVNYLQQSKGNFENYLESLNDQINDLIGNKQLQSLLSRPPESAAEEDAFTLSLISLIYQKTASVDAFRFHVYPIDPSKYADYMSTIGEPVDVEHESWFRKSLVTVSPTWRLSMPEEGNYQRPLLTYIKRFSGLYDQVPRGIIATDLSEDQLKRFFSPSGKMTDQKVLLLDEEGKVIYDSHANAWTGYPFPSGRFIRQTASGAQGSQTVTIDGSKYLATYVRMDSYPWTIASLTPLSELTGTIAEINRLLVIFLIVYLVCCIGVVFYITTYFTQPIVRLVRYMRRLEEGNLQQIIPHSARKDEVGWLYRGYGSLIRRIEGLIADASRAERQKKELEFQVLSHQINPHFLYNTLESIRWKAENHGRSEISEMVSALGNLLRLSLNQGKEITTLGREIEQVKAYVQIEQARMGRTIRILYSVDGELKDVPFLRLLLQPLVENAIQHSIRDNFDQGKILLSARREGDELIVDLVDNGSGIPMDVIEKLEQNSDPNGKSAEGAKGVGLRNVNDRLKLYFGDNCKLHIETSSEGTRISLRHPILKDGELGQGA